MTTAALYARVSSERQVQGDTIASQIQSLKERIQVDGFQLVEEYQFIDNGYSGSNLVRPALEKLRDQAAAGIIDRLYIHSPDRLSRKYAYQMILVEEFQKAGMEIIFLNFQSDDRPESHLLLQMQGMIAEYERAKITERHRRGRIYAAKRGSINVLATAAYGYRYIDKYTGGGQASLEIVEDEAEVILKIFSWIGNDRLTIGEVIRRLATSGTMTKSGKNRWDRSTIWYMLKNPLYKGQAVFGKKKVGKRIVPIRPRKDSCEHPKRNYSRYAVDKEQWIYISVPPIIDENLFEVVQEQLIENRKRARIYPQGETYLLQGLLVCKNCGRAYCGNQSKKKGINVSIQMYYRCLGSDGYRFGGNRICNKSKQISTKILDVIIWEEVKKILKNPQRIFVEYQRRLAAIETSPADQTLAFLEKKQAKLQRGISLLIDSYAQEHINKDEFEPRIKSMKQHLHVIEEQKSKLNEQTNTIEEIKLMITSLENFTQGIESNLDNLNWKEKREIIRQIIKRIELDEENINIVYRINSLSDEIKKHGSTQHCCNRTCNFHCTTLKPL